MHQASRSIIYTYNVKEYIHIFKLCKICILRKTPTTLSQLIIILYLLHSDSKELSLCHKLKFSNPYIFATWQCKSLILNSIPLIKPYFIFTADLNNNVQVRMINRGLDAKIRFKKREDLNSTQRFNL